MIKKAVPPLTILLLFFLLVPLNLWGAVYYFSDKTLATLDAKLRDLRPGDTLIFLPGTYDASGGVTISPNYPHNHSNGLPGNPIILKALEQGTVILDGGNDWTNGGIIQDGALLRLETGLEYWRIEGLTIQNTKGYGILIKGNHLQITKNEITRAGWDGIKTLCGSSDLEVADNLIVRPYEDGIDVLGTDGAKVLRNVIDRSNHDGIFAKGGSRNILIEGNQVIQPAMSGIFIGGLSIPQSMCGTYECTDCKAINNIVEGAGAGGVFALGCDTGLIAQNTIVDANTITNWTASLGAGPGVDDGTGWGLVGSRNIRIANNIVRQSSDSPYTVYLRVYEGSTTGVSSDYNLYSGLSAGPRFSWNSARTGDPKYSLDKIKSAPILQETHAVTADPQFFNPQRGDYHLQIGSPARDAGTPLSPEVTQDFEGTLRPVPGSGSWDVGAYEWSSRPLVIAHPISNLTMNSVTLHGTVNPNGLGTTYGFQWGLTSAYGKAVDGRSILNGTSNVTVTSDLEGLIPNATYHYRLVATSSGGTTTGPDMTFTTGVASLLAPSGILALTAPSFVWYAVSNATQYCLYIDDVTGNKVNRWVTAAEARCGSGTGICSVTPDVLLTPGIGTWKVQTQNDVGLGPWSSSLNFIIDVTRMPQVDLNGDGKTDIIWWYKGNGGIAVWHMDGISLVNLGQLLPTLGPDWEIAGIGDFNSDGKPDFLRRQNTSGMLSLWLMNDSTVVFTGPSWIVDPGWKIKEVGDFNGDGKADILWRHKSSGMLYVWLMNGTTIISQGSPATVGDLNWEIKGVGDFNGDGKTDILWRQANSGQVYIWQMNGTAITFSGSPATVGDLNWEIMDVGDFNGDGRTDILWRHAASGQVYLWLMNGTTISSLGSPGTVDPGWEIKGVGDFNADGKTDILWRHKSSGMLYVWLMNGITYVFGGSPGTVGDGNWQIVAP